MRKIMVLSNCAWDDRNVTNTFTNLFEGWSDAEFTNLYLRDAPPNNPVCHSYFRITDKMLLRYLLTPRRIGQAFEWTHKPLDPASDEGVASAKEKRIITWVHKNNVKLAYTAESLLWRLKGWQNERLHAYLQEKDPDVLFTLAIPSVQRLLQLEYIKANTRARIVLFLADNVCADYLATSGRKGKRQAARMRRLIAMTDKVYGISPELCRVYGEAFGIEIPLLRKGCDFTTPVKTVVNTPLRVVYAGNLLYGRLESLAALASAFARINNNRDGQKIFLEVYSGAELHDSERARLDIPGASTFCGSRQFAEIKKILAEADIVLHVESFDQAQIESVRYSFSTKITDGLQSGSVLAVIGPAGISSVEYPRSIPGVVVVDDLAALEDTFRALVEAPTELIDRANSIRTYAMQYHAIGEVQGGLRADLAAICEQATGR